MLIRGWLADPVQNSNSNHKNCLADNRENYQWDLERERVKCYILLQLKFHWILLLVHNNFPVIGVHFGDGLYMFWHYILFLLLPFVQYFLIEIFRQIFILQYFTCVTFWEDLPVIKNKDINMTRKPTFNLHMLSICDWTWYFQVLKTLGWGGPLPVFFCCCCWDRMASHRLRWSSHDCTKISLGIRLRTGWK